MRCGIFQRALELHPGDDPKLNTRAEIEELIDSCRRCLALPRFTENFRQRTEKAWRAFADEEAGLRRIMDEDTGHTRGAELVTRCVRRSSVWPLTISPSKWVWGSEKYELILTPEGGQGQAV